MKKDIRKPRVSIIMGVYNSETTLPQCIESILGQTYTNWELIMCDDCSTDSSLGIMEQYARQDSRIIIIKNEKNMKLAATLNHCLSVARGEYIARMDADDICMSERLSKQVIFLDEHNQYDVVGCAAKVYNGKSVIEIRACKEVPVKQDMIHGVPYIHPSIMMRKSTYDELGGYTVLPRTVRGQDLDLWFRFYANGHCGYNIQIPLIQYHESEKDLRRRTFKVAVMSSQTMIYGFRILNIEKWKYIYAIKPLIAYFIPNKIKLIKRNHHRCDHERMKS